MNEEQINARLTRDMGTPPPQIYYANETVEERLERELADKVEALAHEAERSKLQLIAHGVNWEIASHVCNYYGCGGVVPGSFICHLLRALDAADPVNMAKLSLGFSEYAAAVSAMKNWTTGKDALVSIAEGGR